MNGRRAMVVTGDASEARRLLRETLTGCDRVLVLPPGAEVRYLALPPRRSVNRARKRVRDRHRVEAQGRHLHLWARMTFGDDHARALVLSFDSPGGPISEAPGGWRGMSSALPARWWSEVAKLWQREAFAPRDFTVRLIEAYPRVATPEPERSAADEAALRRLIVGDVTGEEPAAGSRAVADVHAVVAVGAKGAVET